jgi:hypothetical protein
MCYLGHYFPLRSAGRLVRMEKPAVQSLASVILGDAESAAGFE